MSSKGPIDEDEKRRIVEEFTKRQLHGNQRHMFDMFTRPILDHAKRQREGFKALKDSFSVEPLRGHEFSNVIVDESSRHGKTHWLKKEAIDRVWRSQNRHGSWYPVTDDEVEYEYERLQSDGSVMFLGVDPGHEDSTIVTVIKKRGDKNYIGDIHITNGPNQNGDTYSADVVRKALEDYFKKNPSAEMSIVGVDDEAQIISTRIPGIDKVIVQPVRPIVPKPLNVPIKLKKG